MDNFFFELLKQGLVQLKIPYTEKQLALCHNFYKLYIESMDRLNISTITSSNEFIIKHVLDSLVSYPFIKDSKNIADLGTGGGFPGIILGIFLENSHITLIDVIEKKVQYLKQTIKQLNLKNISIYNASKEKVPGEFNYIVSRAVASLKKLIIYTKPYTKKNTQYLFYKGKQETIKKELNDIKIPENNIKIYTVQVPFLEAERNLVYIAPKKN